MTVYSRRLKRWVAVCTCICFLISLFPEASAAIPSLEVALKSETPRFLNVDIPVELATVDEWYEAAPKPNPKLIVHIQDAHSNYEAQTHIQDVIRYLNKNYGFKTILVEGAAEKLDPQYLKFFPDQERNMQLMDALAKEGEVTGAEMYVMENEKSVDAIGIEKPELYRENFNALQSVYLEDGLTKSFLEMYEKKLGQVASRTFSPHMIQALAEWRKFESGHREFLPFVAQLEKISKETLNLDLDALYSQIEWPQLTRLLVLQRIEKELDQTADQRLTTNDQRDVQRSALSFKQQAELEKQQIVDFLKQKNAPAGLIAGLEKLDDKSVNLNRLGAAEARQASAPRTLIELLVEEGGKIGFDIRHYPAFAKYAGYLIIRSEIIPSALFDEIKKLFDKVLDALVKEPSSAGELQDKRPQTNDQRLTTDDNAANQEPGTENQAETKGRRQAEAPRGLPQASPEVAQQVNPASASEYQIKRDRLLMIYRDETLIRKLLNLELNRGEWLQILERKNRFQVSDLKRRMREVAGEDGTKSQEPGTTKRVLGGEVEETIPRTGGGVPPPVRNAVDRKSEVLEIERLEKAFASAFTFYEAATNREDYFFQKMQNVLEKTDKAILITGGFHAEGMKSLMRQYDINYGTLTPRITKDFSNDVYRKVMMTGIEDAVTIDPSTALRTGQRLTTNDKETSPRGLQNASPEVAERGLIAAGLMGRAEIRSAMEGKPRTEARAVIVRAEARKLGLEEAGLTTDDKRLTAKAGRTESRSTSLEPAAVVSGQRSAARDDRAEMRSNRRVFFLRSLLLGTAMSIPAELLGQTQPAVDEAKPKTALTDAVEIPLHLGFVRHVSEKDFTPEVQAFIDTAIKQTNDASKVTMILEAGWADYLFHLFDQFKENKSIPALESISKDWHKTNKGKPNIQKARKLLELYRTNEKVREAIDQDMQKFYTGGPFKAYGTNTFDELKKGFLKGWEGSFLEKQIHYAAAQGVSRFVFESPDFASSVCYWLSHEYYGQFLEALGKGSLDEAIIAFEEYMKLGDERDDIRDSKLSQQIAELKAQTLIHLRGFGHVKNTQKIVGAKKKAAGVYRPSGSLWEIHAKYSDPAFFDTSKKKYVGFFVHGLGLAEESISDPKKAGMMEFVPKMEDKLALMSDSQAKAWMQNLFTEISNTVKKDTTKTGLMKKLQKAALKAFAQPSRRLLDPKFTRAEMRPVDPLWERLAEIEEDRRKKQMLAELRTMNGAILKLGRLLQNNYLPLMNQILDYPGLSGDELLYYFAKTLQNGLKTDRWNRTELQSSLVKLYEIRQSYWFEKSFEKYLMKVEKFLVAIKAKYPEAKFLMFNVLTGSLLHDRYGRGKSDYDLLLDLVEGLHVRPEDLKLKDFIEYCFAKDFKRGVTSRISLESGIVADDSFTRLFNGTAKYLRIRIGPGKVKASVILFVSVSAGISREVPIGFKIKGIFRDRIVPDSAVIGRPEMRTLLSIDSGVRPESRKSLTGEMIGVENERVDELTGPLESQVVWNHDIIKLFSPEDQKRLEHVLTHGDDWFTRFSEFFLNLSFRSRGLERFLYKKIFRLLNKIDKFLGMAFYKPFPSGEHELTRTIIFKLRTPIRIGDDEWLGAVKIKGGRIPVKGQIQPLDLIEARQPTVDFSMEEMNGKLVPVLRSALDDKRGRGVISGEGARGEHYASILLGAQTANLSVGYGVSTKVMETAMADGKIQRTSVGYQVSLIQDIRDERFYETVRSKVFAALKSRSLDKKNKLKAELEKEFEAYGRAIRDLNEKYIHGSPHSGNVSLRHGKIKIHDLDSLIPISFLNEGETLGYRLNDLFQLLEGVGEFENETRLNGEPSRGFGNKQKQVVAFFQELGIDLNTAVLRGYFKNHSGDSRIQEIKNSKAVDDILFPQGYENESAIPVDINNDIVKLVVEEFSNRGEMRKANWQQSGSGLWVPGEEVAVVGISAGQIIGELRLGIIPVQFENPYDGEETVMTEGGVFVFKDGLTRDILLATPDDINAFSPEPHERDLYPWSYASSWRKEMASLAEWKPREKNLLEVERERKFLELAGALADGKQVMIHFFDGRRGIVRQFALAEPLTKESRLPQLTLTVQSGFKRQAVAFNSKNIDWHDYSIVKTSASRISAARDFLNRVIDHFYDAEFRINFTMGVAILAAIAGAIIYFSAQPDSTKSNSTRAPPATVVPGNQQNQPASSPAPKFENYIYGPALTETISPKTNQKPFSVFHQTGMIHKPTSGMTNRGYAEFAPGPEGYFLERSGPDGTDPLRYFDTITGNGLSTSSDLRVEFDSSANVIGSGVSKIYLSEKNSSDWVYLPVPPNGRLIAKQKVSGLHFWFDGMTVHAEDKIESGREISYGFEILDKPASIKVAPSTAYAADLNKQTTFIPRPMKAVMDTERNGNDMDKMRALDRAMQFTRFNEKQRVDPQDVPIMKMVGEVIARDGEFVSDCDVLAFIAKVLADDMGLKMAVVEGVHVVNGKSGPNDRHAWTVVMINGLPVRYDPSESVRLAGSISMPAKAGSNIWDKKSSTPLTDAQRLELDRLLFNARRLSQLSQSRAPFGLGTKDAMLPGNVVNGHMIRQGENPIRSFQDSLRAVLRDPVLRGLMASSLPTEISAQFLRETAEPRNRGKMGILTQRLSQSVEGYRGRPEMRNEKRSAVSDKRSGRPEMRRRTLLGATLVGVVAMVALNYFSKNPQETAAKHLREIWDNRIRITADAAPTFIRDPRKVFISDGRNYELKYIRGPHDGHSMTGTLVRWLEEVIQSNDPGQFIFYFEGAELADGIDTDELLKGASIVPLEIRLMTVVARDLDIPVMNTIPRLEPEIIERTVESVKRAGGRLTRTQAHAAGLFLLFGTTMVESWEARSGEAETEMADKAFLHAEGELLRSGLSLDEINKAREMLSRLSAEQDFKDFAVALDTFNAHSLLVRNEIAGDKLSEQLAQLRATDPNRKSIVAWTGTMHAPVLSEAAETPRQLHSSPDSPEEELKALRDFATAAARSKRPEMRAAVSVVKKLRNLINTRWFAFSLAALVANTYFLGWGWTIVVLGTGIGIVPIIMMSWAAAWPESYEKTAKWSNTPVFSKSKARAEVRRNPADVEEKVQSLLAEYGMLFGKVNPRIIIAGINKTLKNGKYREMPGNSFLGMGETEFNNLYGKLKVVVIQNDSFLRFVNVQNYQGAWFSAHTRTLFVAEGLYELIKDEASAKAVFFDELVGVMETNHTNNVVAVQVQARKIIYTAVSELVLNKIYDLNKRKKSDHQPPEEVPQLLKPVFKTLEILGLLIWKFFWRPSKQTIMQYVASRLEENRKERQARLDQQPLFTANAWEREQEIAGQMTKDQIKLLPLVLMSDRHKSVRVAAAKSIARLFSRKKAEKVLNKALSLEVDRDVVVEIVTTLFQLSHRSKPWFEWMAVASVGFLAVTADLQLMLDFFGNGSTPAMQAELGARAEMRRLDFPPMTANTLYQETLKLMFAETIRHNRSRWFPNSTFTWTEQAAMGGELLLHESGGFEVGRALLEQAYEKALKARTESDRINIVKAVVKEMGRHPKMQQRAFEIILDPKTYGLSEDSRERLMTLRRPYNMRVNPPQAQVPSIPVVRRKPLERFLSWASSWRRREGSPHGGVAKLAVPMLMENPDPIYSREDVQLMFEMDVWIKVLLESIADKDPELSFQLLDLRIGLALKMRAFSKQQKTKSYEFFDQQIEPLSAYGVLLPKLMEFAEWSETEEGRGDAMRVIMESQLNADNAEAAFVAFLKIKKTAISFHWAASRLFAISKYRNAVHSHVVKIENGGSLEWWIMAGDVLWDQNEETQAEEFYRKAWSLCGDNPHDQALYFVRIARVTGMQFGEHNAAKLLKSAQVTVADELGQFSAVRGDGSTNRLRKLAHTVIRELVMADRYTEAEAWVSRLDRKFRVVRFGADADKMIQEEQDEAFGVMIVAATQKGDMEKASEYLEKMVEGKPEIILEIAKILIKRGDKNNSLIAAALGFASISDDGGIPVDAGSAGTMAVRVTSVSGARILYEIGAGLLAQGEDTQVVGRVLIKAAQLGLNDMDLEVLIELFQKNLSIRSFVLLVLQEVLRKDYKFLSAFDHYRVILRALRLFYPEVTQEKIVLPDDFIANPLRAEARRWQKIAVVLGLVGLVGVSIWFFNSEDGKVAVEEEALFVRKTIDGSAQAPSAEKKQDLKDLLSLHLFDLAPLENINHLAIDQVREQIISLAGQILKDIQGLNSLVANQTLNSSGMPSFEDGLAISILRTKIKNKMMQFLNLLRWNLNSDGSINAELEKKLGEKISISGLMESEERFSESGQSGALSDFVDQVLMQSVGKLGSPSFDAAATASIENVRIRVWATGKLANAQFESGEYRAALKSMAGAIMLDSNPNGSFENSLRTMLYKTPPADLLSFFTSPDFVSLPSSYLADSNLALTNNGYIANAMEGGLDPAVVQGLVETHFKAREAEVAAGRKQPLTSEEIARYQAYFKRHGYEVELNPTTRQESRKPSLVVGRWSLVAAQPIFKNVYQQLPDWLKSREGMQAAAGFGVSFVSVPFYYAAIISLTASVGIYFWGFFAIVGAIYGLIQGFNAINLNAQLSRSRSETAPNKVRRLAPKNIAPTLPTVPVAAPATQAVSEFPASQIGPTASALNTQMNKAQAARKIAETQKSKPAKRLLTPLGQTLHRAALRLSKGVMQALQAFKISGINLELINLKMSSRLATVIIAFGLVATQIPTAEARTIFIEMTEAIQVNQPQPKVDDASQNFSGIASDLPGYLIKTETVENALKLLEAYRVFMQLNKNEKLWLVLSGDQSSEIVDWAKELNTKLKSVGKGEVIVHFATSEAKAINHSIEIAAQNLSRHPVIALPLKISEGIPDRTAARVVAVDQFNDAQSLTAAAGVEIQASQKSAQIASLAGSLLGEVVGVEKSPNPAMVQITKQSLGQWIVRFYQEFMAAYEAMKSA